MELSLGDTRHKLPRRLSWSSQWRPLDTMSCDSTCEMSVRAAHQRPSGQSSHCRLHRYIPSSTYQYPRLPEVKQVSSTNSPGTASHPISSQNDENLPEIQASRHQPRDNPASRFPRGQQSQACMLILFCTK